MVVERLRKREIFPMPSSVSNISALSVVSKRSFRRCSGSNNASRIRTPIAVTILRRVTLIQFFALNALMLYIECTARGHFYFYGNS